MSSLVGMRFRPSDEEIINYFLKKKRDDPNYSVDTINQVDIYKFEPSALPNLSLIQSKEPEWFFFCALGYKNKRAKRSTESGSGYWKITGKHRNAKTKRTKQVIGTKKTLVFYHRNPGSKDTKTNWVMHEYHSNHPQDAFVICRIKRKPDRRPNTATPVTVFHQPHHDIISDSANHEAENAFPEEDNSPLPNHYVVSNSRNHVAQNTNQLLSNHHMVSDLGNHVGQNTNQTFSDQCMVYDIANDVAQNTNQNPYMVSDLGSFVAQNTFLQVEPLLLAKLNALDDCYGLGHNSLSEPQLPIQSEQELSYSTGFSNDCNVSSSQLHNEQEGDFWNLQWDVHGDYSCEETVCTLPSYESARRVHGGDNNDTDTETVDGGVDEYPSIAEFYFNSPCNPQLDFIGEYKYY